MENEIGERFGKLETIVGVHDKHMIEVNGAIRDNANAVGRLVTEMAIQTVAITKIQETLQHEDTEKIQHKSWSIQVWLAIFAGATAFMLTACTALLTIVITLANLFLN